MADGIFTPAVSVTSAVGGMAVAKASINKDVIPVSIVCLVLVDRRSSHSLFPGLPCCPFFNSTIWNASDRFFICSKYVALFFVTVTHPDSFLIVSFMWFLLLAGTGIYNVTRYPGIFRAFDPSRAILRKLFKLIRVEKPSNNCSLRAHQELRYPCWRAPCTYWM